MKLHNLLKIIASFQTSVSFLKVAKEKFAESIDKSVKAFEEALPEDVDDETLTVKEKIENLQSCFDALSAFIEACDSDIKQSIPDFPGMSTFMKPGEKARLTLKYGTRIHDIRTAIENNLHYLQTGIESSGGAAKDEEDEEDVDVGASFDFNDFKKHVHTLMNDIENEAKSLGSIDLNAKKKLQFVSKAATIAFDAVLENRDLTIHAPKKDEPKKEVAKPEVKKTEVAPESPKTEFDNLFNTLSKIYKTRSNGALQEIIMDKKLSKAEKEKKSQEIMDNSFPVLDSIDEVRNLIVEMMTKKDKADVKEINTRIGQIVDYLDGIGDSFEVINEGKQKIKATPETKMIADELRKIWKDVVPSKSDDGIIELKSDDADEDEDEGDIEEENEFGNVFEAPANVIETENPEGGGGRGVNLRGRTSRHRGPKTPIERKTEYLNAMLRRFNDLEKINQNDVDYQKLVETKAAKINRKESKKSLSRPDNKTKNSLGWSLTENLTRINNSRRQILKNENSGPINIFLTWINENIQKLVYENIKKSVVRFVFSRNVSEFDFAKQTIRSQIKDFAKYITSQTSMGDESLQQLEIVTSQSQDIVDKVVFSLSELNGDFMLLAKHVENLMKVKCQMALLQRERENIVTNNTGASLKEIESGIKDCENQIVVFEKIIKNYVNRTILKSREKMNKIKEMSVIISKKNKDVLHSQIDKFNTYYDMIGKKLDSINRYRALTDPNISALFNIDFDKTIPENLLPFCGDAAARAKTILYNVEEILKDKKILVALQKNKMSNEKFFLNKEGEPTFLDEDDRKKSPVLSSLLDVRTALNKFIERMGQYTDLSKLENVGNIPLRNNDILRDQIVEYRQIEQTVISKDITAGAPILFKTAFRALNERAISRDEKTIRSNMLQDIDIDRVILCKSWLERMRNEVEDRNLVYKINDSIAKANSLINILQNYKIIPT